MEHRGLDSPSQTVFALLVGIFVMSILVGSVALSQAPVPPPPVKAAPFFVLNATFAAVSLPLVWWRRVAGYAGALVVGLWGIATLLLIMVGALGETPPGLNPIGPLVLLVLSLMLIASTVVALRRRRSLPATEEEPRLASGEHA